MANSQILKSTGKERMTPVPAEFISHHQILPLSQVQANLTNNNHLSLFSLFFLSFSFWSPALLSPLWLITINFYRCSFPTNRRSARFPNPRPPSLHLGGYNCSTSRLLQSTWPVSNEVDRLLFRLVSVIVIISLRVSCQFQTPSRFVP